MYIHVFRQKKSSSLHRYTRDLGKHTVHPAPARLPQPSQQAFLGARPAWPRGLKLMPPRRGQAQNALPPIFSRLHADPSAFLQQSEHARQGCRVQRQQLAELSLRSFARDIQGHEQGVLRQFESGCPKFVVIHPRDRPRRATEVCASTRQHRQCGRSIAWGPALHPHNICIYIFWENVNSILAACGEALKRIVTARVLCRGPSQSCDVTNPRHEEHAVAAKSAPVRIEWTAKFEKAGSVDLICRSAALRKMGGLLSSMSRRLAAACVRYRLSPLGVVAFKSERGGQVY